MGDTIGENAQKTLEELDAELSRIRAKGLEKTQKKIKEVKKPQKIVPKETVPKKAIPAQKVSIDVWFQAIEKGDINAVKSLIANKADVNAKDEYGWTVLHFAARYGHKEIVKLLIANKADVNAKDNGGWIALHGAAWNGRIEVAKLLIAKEANVNAKDKDGWTALHFAAQNGYIEVVRFLIEKGADVNAKGENGKTVLYLAAKYGYMDAVKLLIANKADVNAKDIYGKTAADVTTNNEIKKIIQSARLLPKKEEVKKEIVVPKSIPQQQKSPISKEIPALDEEAARCSKFLKELSEDKIKNGTAKFLYGPSNNPHNLITELTPDQRKWLGNKQHKEIAAKQLESIIKEYGAGKNGFDVFKKWIVKTAQQVKTGEEKLIKKVEKESVQKVESAQKVQEKVDTATQMIRIIPKKREIPLFKWYDFTILPLLWRHCILRVSDAIGWTKPPIRGTTLLQHIEKKRGEIAAEVYSDPQYKIEREKRPWFSWQDVAVIPFIWRNGVLRLTDAVGWTKPPIANNATIPLGAQNAVKNRLELYLQGPEFGNILKENTLIYDSETGTFYKEKSK